MIGGNKNGLRVSGVVLCAAVAGCTAEAPAPSETPRPPATSEQSRQPGQPSPIQDMGAIALRLRDNPPGGATHVVETPDPNKNVPVGDLITGTTKDGKPWRVRILPAGIKEIADVGEVEVSVNPGTASEKTISAQANMFAQPFHYQMFLQYPYAGTIEGVAQPTVTVGAYRDETAPLDREGAQLYATKNVRGAGVQANLVACSITYTEPPFPQLVTLGEQAIGLLQQGDDPTLKAPQAAFYGTPDQNTLCASA